MNPEPEALPRMKYEPTTLTVYGSLSELTLGGTGSITEADAMNMSSNNRA